MSDTKSPIGRYRWVICALLFFATTINYMDRSILGVLAPTLQYKVFNWSDKDYATINIAFKIAYAIGLLTMGAIVDRFGTKIGYTLSIAIWSAFGMLHAAVRPAFSLLGFSLARFGLGFGEAGNFPAAIKTVGEWFPKKERAFATGIFNAGTNVGATLAPLVIPLVVLPDGTNWQYAFLTTGFFSLVWVIVWLKIYKRPEEHPKLSKAELDYINSDSVAETPTVKLPWSKVLPVRETWAFAAAKLTDAVWWFYLFWGGKFLFDQFGLNIKSLALPLIIIYVIADVGSVFGGWLSSFFIKRGWPINRARKSTLLLCAVCILPVMFVTQVKTQFVVDDGYFDRLSKSTYKVEEVKVVDGKPRAEKVAHSVDPVLLESLRSLSGQRFNSAKEFLKASSLAVGTPALISVKPALIDSAPVGAKIDDAYFERIKSAVPADMIKPLKSLAGKKFDSKEEFVDAVTLAVGKTRFTPIESIAIDASRTNKLYWIAVLLIALGAASHQAWSCNIFTLVSDVFPKKAVASVTGIGGMFGALAGMAADLTLGQVLSKSGPSGYFFAFMIAGSLYLVMLGVAHLLMPKMTPLDENLRRIE